MSLFVNTTTTPHILVVQHSENAPGGNFCKGLMKRGARLTTCTPLASGSLPLTPDGFDGLVVLGGPQHAADDHECPHFIPLMNLIRSFDENKKPVAGICLGCQLLARAYGEAPKKMGFLEFGFIQHTLTEQGKLDPVSNTNLLPPLMEFHQDTFELPKGATLLIQGSRCRNQCFKIGNASYGFQFHLEVDRARIEQWLKLFSSGKMTQYNSHRKSFSVEDFDDLTANIESYIKGSEQFCDIVSGRWLELTTQYRKMAIRRSSNSTSNL